MTDNTPSSSPTPDSSDQKREQPERRVLAFYKFQPLSALEDVQEQLTDLCSQAGILGTILLANEGVNGTVVGPVAGLKQLAAALTQFVGPIEFKWSDLQEHNPGFHRLKVRIKPEIVTFGVPDLDIKNNGFHVGPDEWHALLADENIKVIDTRNTYEIDIGTFPGAISPETTNFREFPEWVANNLDPEEDAKVAMFCTGGIRCEKASAYLLSQGFEAVYQLDGGILKYLENVEPEENHWEGECFVFDQRVSVNAELEQGQYKQCFACRHPLAAEDLAHPSFEHGVSCRFCSDVQDEDRATRFRQRNKQVRLAAERGETHIGRRMESVRDKPKPAG